MTVLSLTTVGPDVSQHSREDSTNGIVNAPTSKMIENSITVYTSARHGLEEL
jgi:hypothetical protein